MKRKSKYIDKQLCRRDYALKYAYGLCLEEYYELLEKQDDCCAICGRHQNLLKRALVVDHDHYTGKVRGLLCNRCNQLLGIFNDNIKTIEKAIT